MIIFKIALTVLIVAAIPAFILHRINPSYPFDDPSLSIWEGLFKLIVIIAAVVATLAGIWGV